MMSEEQASSDFDAMLRDWVVADFTFEFSLIGRIYHDRKERFPDGRWVITSAVKAPKHKIVAGNVIRTRNTRYLLMGTSN